MKNGKRPEIPAKDIDKELQDNNWIIQLIKDCWEKDPKKRPKFSNIIEIIINGIEEKDFERYVKSDSFAANTKSIIISKEKEENEAELSRKLCALEYGELIQLGIEKSNEVEQYQQIIEGNDILIKQKDEDIKYIENEIKRKDEEIKGLSNLNEKLEELVRLQVENIDAETVKHVLDEKAKEIRRKDTILKSKNENLMLKDLFINEFIKILEKKESELIEKEEFIIELKQSINELRQKEYNNE